MIGQALAHLAVPVDAAKERARANASGSDPLLERSDGAGDLTERNGDGLARAFLVCLAVTDCDFHSVRRSLDVLDVERD